MNLAIRMMVLGPVQTNCFFLINEDTKEVLVIDPADHAQKIIEWMKSENLKPVAILLTHGHFDHIMGVEGIRKEYGIPVYASRDEVDVLAKPQLNVSTMMGAYLSMKADELFADGDVLELAGMKLKVISTPGHTIGSVCFYIEEEKVLISGDTLFEASVGRTDFPTGSSRQLIESIKTRLFILPDDTSVFPGHGGTTSIGYEKLHNPFVY
ncbi:MBL fold metallo-hydrolase [Frisingicoccus sp.]|uniref:MBL fold metallo-hydrolase n=1 Tax=Frisingicoccus sp. TaxID=1918627 RepID=UPI002A8327DD|nr:MBL fold metallo-hydrolase [Frisingicoccus sp.]MDY4835000.1 MBL fold metallo-hydrolase [Frisingicoccus sp.]MDY4921759.1 MBL fold metallo-hydrolase [Frisingicoccus sp.]MDY5956082.1 MBL fold metallo-hydrolase [Frisingicoccus sp.]